MLLHTRAQARHLIDMASTIDHESDWTDIDSDSEAVPGVIDLAVQLLASDPNAAFTKASEGSLVHVFAIRKQIGTLPPKRQEEALKIFCSHLDLGPDLNYSEHTLSKRCFEGIASMKALFKAAAERKSKDNLQNDFVPILIQNLARILSLCRMASMAAFDTIQTKGLERQTHEDLRNTVDMLLALELSGSDVRELLPDDVLSIALNAWWYEDLPMEDWYSSGNSTAFLTSYLGRKYRRDPSAQLKWVTNIELTATGIVSKVLEKIEVSMDQIRFMSNSLAFDTLYDNTVIADYIQHCVVFGNMTSIQQRWFRDDIRREFRERGTGKLFAEVIELLIDSFTMKLEEPVEDKISIYRAAWSCSTFLLNYCNFQGSWPMLIRPVRAGFLLLIVIVLRFVGPVILSEFELARKVKVLLSDVIPPYLVSYDVLNSIPRWMRSLSASCIRHAVEEAGFKAELEVFEKLVFELTVCRRLYELKCKDKVPIKDTEACHYCKTSQLKIDLKKCSGCRTALYCDRRCQTAARPKHKKNCKDMDAERKSTGFLKFLAMTDIRRHKKSFEAVDKTIPRALPPLIPRVTVVDYTKVPYVISTISFSECYEIGICDGNEKLPTRMGALEVKLETMLSRQVGTTSIRSFGSEGGVPNQHIMLIELIEPKLRRTAPKATAQYGSTSTDRPTRRKAHDEKGNILQADRDEVDEVLEDVYEMIRSNRPAKKIGIWKALDLVLPLKKN